MTIDVSKCEYYNGGECFCNYCVAYGYEITGYDNCKDHKDCYYKQLQQLKAEKENLKEEYNSIYDYLQEREKLINTQIVELFKLKAENEKLRNLQVGFCQGEKLYNLYSYKQCLEEIKEIAKGINCNGCESTDCNRCYDNFKNKINEKISEVLE